MEKPTLATIQQTYNDFPDSPVYLTIFGSHLWGTAVATSDYDVRGICLESPRALIGLGGFAQYERLEPIDITVWGLRKFTELAIGNNPNILCVLFSPITHPNNPNGTTLYHSWAWKYIHDLRHSFLVKDKITDNFIGYAWGQYIKANKHVQWLKNPPKMPDSRKYGYVDNHGWEYASHKQKVEFDAKKKEYENYTKWVENRNQKRHETELLYGIDCYSDDTEFLTDSGWKLFDNIGASDRLATINPETGAIEYQSYVDRVKKSYDGIMYEHNGFCINNLVTPNHRMLARYGKTGYKFIPAAELYGKNRNTWIKKLFINPNVEYNIDDDLLKLYGLYISEGSLSFRDNKPKCVNLSQSNHGKSAVFDIMRDISQKFKFKEYSYRRNSKLIEYRWTTHDKTVFEYLLDCGHKSNYKKLPRFFRKLSKRQARILLNALLLGDGTEKKSSWTYYTNSPKLADEIQELAMFAGYNANIYNYLDDHDIIQIYISKNEDLEYHFYTRNINQMHYTGNIVCFTVPNETLITRRAGKISMHGNTKNLYNMVMLLELGIELLKTGEMEFPRPNKDVLLDIRNGGMNYEQAGVYLEQRKAEMEAAKESSRLPNKPDTKAIERVVMEILYQNIWDKYKG